MLGLFSNLTQTVFVYLYLCIWMSDTCLRSLYHLLFKNISHHGSFQGFSGRKLCGSNNQYTYGSDSPGRGKWAICGTFFKFLKLYCDQTVGLFQVLSTVLKRFCPVHPKNTFVLVLAFFLDFWKILRFWPEIKFLGNFTVSLTLLCDQTFADGLDWTSS